MGVPKGVTHLVRFDLTSTCNRLQIAPILQMPPKNETVNSAILDDHAQAPYRSQQFENCGNDS